MSQAYRLTRNQRKLDYSVLHKTGERVYKESNQVLSEIQSNSSSDSLNNSMDDPVMAASNDSNESLLLIQADALSDDINDFLDENPVEDISESINDIEISINKVEVLISYY